MLVQNVLYATQDVRPKGVPNVRHNNSNEQATAGEPRPDILKFLYRFLGTRARESGRTLSGM